MKIDIMAENGNQGYNLTAIVSTVLGDITYRKTYIFFSLREAKKRFRRELRQTLKQKHLI